MAYGTVNADVIQSSVSGVSLGAGNASIMKNRIINGAMVIDQRNAGASVTFASAYCLDRYAMNTSQASKGTVQQNAGSVTPPAGFTNYLGFTSSSAYSSVSSDYFGISQLIEGFNVADLGWGTANAKTVTLSFWVYSSLTGTFGGSFRNSAGNRSYPFSYTIGSANTWTLISITVTGDTTGTWLTNNGVGISVWFDLGTGSTYKASAGAWTAGNYVSATGATSVVGTNGATFYITGVQLEVGTSATGFEYRQYQQELALCQRYFISYGGTDIYEHFFIGQAASTTLAGFVPQFLVEMRAAPTLGYNSVSSFWVNDASVQNATSALTISYSSSKNTTLTVTTTGLTLGRAVKLLSSGSTATRLTFSAEL